MPDGTDAPDTGTDDKADDATAADSQPDTPDTGDDTTDWQVEADKYKALARKHEQRAKSNAGAVKELEQLKASQMSDTEKAVAEAEARGHQTATAAAGQRLAAAEIKAALTGVVPDPAKIVEDLNLSKFVDDGEVDLAAVTALKDKYAALAPKDAPAGGTPGQRPTENLPSVPLPGSKDIQLDEEKDPRKLAARIRRL